MELYTRAAPQGSHMVAEEVVNVAAQWRASTEVQVLWGMKGARSAGAGACADTLPP